MCTNTAKNTLLYFVLSGPLLPKNPGISAAAAKKEIFTILRRFNITISTVIKKINV